MALKWHLALWTRWKDFLWVEFKRILVEGSDVPQALF